ncbi:MAG: uncharacterized protein MJ0240-like [Parcubacteria group bacterium Licking1014_17]|nr:MAG: uncharacterized protein MJ0240-like [Parcubacteria group bacterium Licking1014_17]
MKNIELKIIIDGFDGITETLKNIGADFKGELSQADVYFNCPKGRLKIREINDEKFELIFYERPDSANSKVSEYEIVELSENQADCLINILDNILGKKADLNKIRKLWVYEHTRIHLDNVSELGNFLELETVVKDMTFEQAEEEHKKLIDLLDIAHFKKVGKSYVELFLEKSK